MPRVRPPYPAEEGLHGMPTVVENVETLATVPWIISQRGRASSSRSAAAHAPGTRLFTLQRRRRPAGHLRGPARHHAEEAGRGAPAASPARRGRRWWVRLAAASSRPDFLTFRWILILYAETGGDISSGVIRVLGADDCIVETVRECLAFSASQSCGKCVPCRLGTWRLLDIVDRDLRRRGLGGRPGAGRGAGRGHRRRLALRPGPGIGAAAADRHEIFRPGIR